MWSNRIERTGEGNVNMEQVKEISYEIDDPGSAIGMGSAEPMSEENFFDSKVKTFAGKLKLAI